MKQVIKEFFHVLYIMIGFNDYKWKHISDNMFGFDGYILGHDDKEILPPGYYYCRESGSLDCRWRKLSDIELNH
jgi:hypothetical protein